MAGSYPSQRVDGLGTGQFCCEIYTIYMTYEQATGVHLQLNSKSVKDLRKRLACLLYEYSCDTRNWKKRMMEESDRHADTNIKFGTLGCKKFVKFGVV